jgi:hypothetical protein
MTTISCRVCGKDIKAENSEKCPFCDIVHPLVDICKSCFEDDKKAKKKDGEFIDVDITSSKDSKVKTNDVINKKLLVIRLNSEIKTCENENKSLIDNLNLLNLQKDNRFDMMFQTYMANINSTLFPRNDYCPKKLINDVAGQQKHLQDVLDENNKRIEAFKTALDNANGKVSK